MSWEHQSPSLSLRQHRWRRKQRQHQHRQAAPPLLPPPPRLLRPSHCWRGGEERRAYLPMQNGGYNENAPLSARSAEALRFRLAGAELAALLRSRRASRTASGTDRWHAAEIVSRRTAIQVAQAGIPHRGSRNWLVDRAAQGWILVLGRGWVMPEAALLPRTEALQHKGRRRIWPPSALSRCGRQRDLCPIIATPSHGDVTPAVVR